MKSAVGLFLKMFPYHIPMIFLIAELHLCVLSPHFTAIEQSLILQQCGAKAQISAVGLFLSSSQVPTLRALRDNVADGGQVSTWTIEHSVVI